MIYGVQKLVRYEVSASSYYDFTVEDQLDVNYVMGAFIRFYNNTTDDCEFRVQYTVAQTGVFSDTYTAVDTAVIKTATYTYEFQLPLVKSSKITPAVRFTNNDLSDRYLYAIIGGWTDINQVLSSYVGAV
jgi:hypothetical protein